MVKSKIKVFCTNQNSERDEVVGIWLIKALFHTIIICFAHTWLSNNKIYYDSINIYEHYLISCSSWMEGSFFDSYCNMGRIYALLLWGKVFPYEVVFGLSALLWWLVGLYMLRSIKIRNMPFFLLFSLVFVFDAIYIMQPSKELIAILYWCLVINALRAQEKWSYVVAGILTIIYGIFFRPYILITLIIYVWLQIYRTNKKAAILTASIAGICFLILFQMGKMEFLVNARIIRADNSTIYPVFSKDAMSDNVFLYLVNCFLSLIRIVLPFESFVTVPNRSFIIVPIQLSMLYIYIRSFTYLFGLKEKGLEFNREDKLLFNVLMIHVANLFTQAIFEPDYGSLLRHMCGMMPIYLFLLFEKRVNMRKQAETDSQVPELPVVFTHEGDSKYVYDVITQAERVCGKRNVYLLGDESNKEYSFHWKNMNDYLGESYDKFLKYYEHLSYTPYAFEVSCFKRHFALYEFMKQNTIQKCISCDSDLLIYKNIRELDWEDANFLCSSSLYPVRLGECMSPHCTYWKIDWLEKFLCFVLDTYENNIDILKEICESQKASGYYWVGAISDMTLLTLWKQEEQRNNPDFTWRNLNSERNGCVFDHNISVADNLVENEYLYAKTLHMKKVVFSEGYPCFKRRDGTLVESYTLHCQGGKKKYIPLLLNKNPIYVCYLFVNILDVAVREIRRVLNRMRRNEEPIRWKA